MTNPHRVAISQTGSDVIDMIWWFVPIPDTLNKRHVVVHVPLFNMTILYPETPDWEDRAEKDILKTINALRMLNEMSTRGLLENFERGKINMGRVHKKKLELRYNMPMKIRLPEGKKETLN